jgi:hypothetical protein
VPSCYVFPSRISVCSSALVAGGCALVAGGCALVAGGCALVAGGCALVAGGCILRAHACFLIVLANIGVSMNSDISARPEASYHLQR